MRLSRLDAAAPSSTLLKFLRSQTENLCFLTYSAKPGLYHRRPSPEPTVQSGRKVGRDHPSTRLISLDKRRPQSVGAIRSDPDLLGLPFKRRKSTALPAAHRIGSTLKVRSAVWQQQSRYASTGSHPWLRRLWDFKSRSGQPALKPDDLPPLTSFLDEGAETSMFNLGRSLAGKASNELKLRCTEFDENGNVTLVNGEFKKSELIAKVSFCCPIISHTALHEYSCIYGRSMACSHETCARSIHPSYRISLSGHRQFL